MEDITADSLTLAHSDHFKRIAKNDIDEIARERHGFREKLLGVLLVLAGIFVTGFFILFQITYNLTRTDRQLAAGEQKLYWPLAIVGLGIIALGIVSLRSPTMRISKPFGKDWTIQEKPAKTNKIP